MQRTRVVEMAGRRLRHLSGKVHRGRGPIVVLVYHMIAATPSDPFGLAVSPELFEAHARMLAREFDVIPASAIRNASARARVVVTFDDGYVDNLEVAAPLLAAQGLPATFFVNTPRRSDREMWWNELTHALAAPVACDFLEIEVGRRVAVDVRNETAREQAVINLAAHLETMSIASVEAILSSVYRQLGVEPHRCALHRVLKDHELVELQRLGAFEIGCHTPSHAALVALDDEEAAEEIAASRSHLTELFGTVPESFAYPFGSLGYTFTAGHAQMIQGAGFSQAFTTEHQDVARWFDPYLVPRITVPPVVADDLHLKITQAMGI